jgi:hypothetical protein
MAKKYTLIKPVAAAVGVAFVTSLVVSTVAVADNNPFDASDLDAGYMLADSHEGEGSCGEGEGSCGEGSCGEGEGSCGEGEGSCGEGEGSCGEGSCGEGEGSCGEKGDEGKCGEGKCGGAS